MLHAVILHVQLLLPLGELAKIERGKVLRVAYAVSLFNFHFICIALLTVDNVTKQLHRNINVHLHP